jgi:hypothetical protein
MEIGYGNSQYEAIPDVSPKPRAHRRKPLHSYTIVPLSKYPRGHIMSNLDNALRELREKRSHAQVEIDKLDQIIFGIESLNGTGASGKATQPKRIISAASRRKMARAQRARWAGLRKNSQPVGAVAKSTGSAPKRTMSASARRKIAAAQKARWAKIRAANKTAA